MQPSIQSNSELYDYLEQQESRFIEEWTSQILLDPEDPFKDNVSQNGFKMFELVKQTITGKDVKEHMITLAGKVANERVEANINIGSFVYNVNVGRSIIIKFILKSGIDLENLSLTITKINNLFDDFCYQAVTMYTDIKNEELQQKKFHINQVHKDKLAILGQMSSSFVHEFRNPLTSIIGFNKLLRNEYPNLKYLDIMELELDQLKFRITQFLHTSKMDILGDSNKKMKLRELLEDILNFLYPSFVDVDVQTNLSISEDIEIEANKDEIKQVFVNLLMNSIEALRQKVKPRIINISVEQNTHEEVIIKISNNGPTIPLEVRETIFEPFFTTKDLGTGIGLYVCKNIIEKHQGIMTCDSNEEETTFLISLPAKSK
ncbi:histidine kinase N-terminal domain-containing protein [Halalkalibacter krulwichiae]|uniref:histidine kinase n=1 Tax=Halalkalibacter krulwichiae TaxID=199441 RepID=A0A1X9MCH4_9BACI|nr:histidine kinase N-terminal domain-containing protein [Halalkalibacter krulwichiae]ARK29271.1 Sporulation kinase A [Halalkalibacter krulwichiae]